MGPGTAALARIALAAVAAAVAAAALGACRRAPPPPPPALVAGPDRFPHAAHPTIGCPTCHDPEAIQAGEARAPGADDHAPCDDGQCHGAAFREPPGPLCRVCHTTVDPSGRGPSPLRPFPADDLVRNLPSRFSHAIHLDAARMEAAVGFHVSCRDCHGGLDAERPTAAEHGACARCHADEVGLAGGPPLSDCQGCHRDDAAARHPRRLITGDLRFAHELHRVDARGQAIACSTCHAGAAQATTSETHAPPTTATCVACHDDAARVPVARRMRICETCHRDKAESIGALAPRSHLPASERPVDHTLAFRRDHRAEAADAARCAGCHAMMSGSPRAACDECHQVMEPSDHTVLWREYDHGAEAVVAADRCATCHVVDYCTACHRRPPRSHAPLGSFGTGDHGDLARQNPRACLTCHEPARDCVGAGCHQGITP
ncbi:MAG: hypothetical protein HS111_39890 [Kofleriaceae bacterium]|nr:hypothetical protein [Kofleriaceae bacterium]MCL4226185.1 hypothetical protein [Myxococcales bacterium]